MTASTLRHAAAAMREQHTPGRGYMGDTFLEVAAFLDFAAAYGDQPAPQSPTVQFALSIANAYMQADAKADAL